MRTSIYQCLCLMVFMTLFGSCADTSVALYTEDGIGGRVLMGATVHLGNGEFIENASIGIKDGYIIFLTEGVPKKIDLSKFQIDELSDEYHIYSFKKADLSNSGIVLPRADSKPFNIVIRNSEEEKCVSVGAQAALLICKGSIQDISRFRVEYVIDGNDKVKILEQSDYGVGMIR